MHRCHQGPSPQRRVLDDTARCHPGAVAQHSQAADAAPFLPIGSQLVLGVTWELHPVVQEPGNLGPGFAAPGVAGEFDASPSSLGHFQHRMGRSSQNLNVLALAFDVAAVVEASVNSCVLHGDVGQLDGQFILGITEHFVPRVS